MTLSRRNFLQSSAISALGISAFQHSLFANMLNSEDPFKMSTLRNNVGFFTEHGGTIGWMISKDGIVVVDTQFPEQSGHLIEAIKKRVDRKIDVLINTHHHGDHSAGNIAYKGIAETIIAHENSKKNQMRVARERGQEDNQLYPDTTFGKEWSRKIGSETVVLRYFGPAHTDGDAIIHFENANVVHMGDLVFNRRYPYIDKSAGASVHNWIEVLNQTRNIFDDDTTFIFGHSDNGFDIIGKLNDVRAFQNYLTRLLETVDVAIKSGKSKDEIMKITMIEGAGEWKGKGIERSLSATYQELATE